MRKIKHDDFCPCTRFMAQPEFCRCGAVSRDEIVSGAISAFSTRLREINRGVKSDRTRFAAAIRAAMEK